MDAVADQYKDQLYFHMYMSSIVKDEEGFNDMWQYGSGSEDSGSHDSDSGSDSESGSGSGSDSDSEESGEDSEDNTGDSEDSTGDSEDSTGDSEDGTGDSEDGTGDSEDSNSQEESEEDECVIEICFKDPTDLLGDQRRCEAQNEDELVDLIESGFFGQELIDLPDFGERSRQELEEDFVRLGGNLADL